MRRFALLVLLLSCAACARKAQPVADGGAPELPDLVPVEVKPKKALDPNNFAGKSLAQWREDLRSKDRHKIIAAMKACEALGPLAVDAIPDILAADIDTPDQRAYEEFHAMKSEAWPGVVRAIGKSAVPLLLPLLEVPDEKAGFEAPKGTALAFSALRGLAAIGPDAGDAIPKLTALLKHTKSSFPDAAASTLLAVAGSDKRAVPGLLFALDTHDGFRSPVVGQCPPVIDALSRLDPDGTAERCLAMALVRDRWDERRMSTETFLRFGPKGIAAAVARAKRADGKLNGMVLYQLSEAPAEQLAPHVPQFVKWIDAEPVQAQRYSVYSILRKVGPRGKEAIPRLLEFGRGGDADALRAAAVLGAPLKDVLDIIRARKDGDPSAVWLLTAYGPQLKGELPRFVTAMKASPAPYKAQLAAGILHSDPEHAEAIGTFLDAQVEIDRTALDRNLATLNPYPPIPKAAVPALKAHLKRADTHAQLLGALAILKQVADDADAARLLAENLSDLWARAPGDKPERMPVTARFDLLRNAGPAGARQLGEVLTRDDATERALAAKALFLLGTGSAPAANALRAVAGSEPDPLSLGFVLRALGNASSPQQPFALDVSRKHLTAGDRFVRFCAAEAILKCDSADEPALKVLDEFVKPLAEMRKSEWNPEMGLTDLDSATERKRYGLSFGVRGEAVPLLFRLDPERAIRVGAFRDLWFRNNLEGE
jgi:hypothetical protein